MRLLQTALLSATLLATATSAAAMTRPPTEGGGSSSGGGHSSGGTSVPEPGALAMMGTGVAGYGAAVAMYRRKKRKQKG